MEILQAGSARALACEGKTGVRFPKASPAGEPVFYFVSSVSLSLNPSLMPQRPANGRSNFTEEVILTNIFLTRL
jgi:hypothetical protein